jgi:hypothetical protein
VQVVKVLLSQSIGQWPARAYYRLFVAEVHKHMAGQEYFLFSWRLVACDLVSTVGHGVISLIRRS